MDSNNNSANMKLSPGMMCLVIGCSNPSNYNRWLGTTVTLVEQIRMTFSEMWVCEEFQGCGIDAIMGKHLMPIRPEEDPLEITDVIIKKEKA